MLIRPTLGTINSGLDLTQFGRPILANWVKVLDYVFVLVYVKLCQLTDMWFDFDWPNLVSWNVKEWAKKESFNCLSNASM